MNEVFDLTSGDFDSDKLDIFIKRSRKDYLVHKPENGKIEVNFTTEDDQNFSCIYFYKSNQEVYDMIRQEQPLNLRYTYIKDFDIEEIDHLREYKLNNVKASYSFWDGKIDFSWAKFDNSDVDFSNTQFGDGNIDFFKAYFGDGDVNFNNTQFGHGDVDFSNTLFGHGSIYFKNAQFGDGNVKFVKACFGDGNVKFSNTLFGDGNIDFSEACFYGGNIDFNEAHFGDGDVSFKGTRFHCEVNFCYAYFYIGNLYFQNAYAQKITFMLSTFSSHVDLRLRKIKELIVEDCIIEKTIKCHSTASYEKLSFLNTINLGQIYIDWDNNGIFKSINNGMKLLKVSYEESAPFTSEEKASQFRMLKENFHNIGYYDDEDKAYRAYMKFKTNNIKRCWMKIFGLIGGYGTQAWKVIIAALAVIAVFGGIFTAPMQLAEKLPNDITFSCSFFKGLYFSAITFLTIGYGDISPPNQTVALLAGIEGFLGLFLMSYFTVCVVRKLLR